MASEVWNSTKIFTKNKFFVTCGFLDGKFFKQRYNKNRKENPVNFGGQVKRYIAALLVVFPNFQSTLSFPPLKSSW